MPRARKFAECLQRLLARHAARGNGKLAELIQELIEARKRLLLMARACALSGEMQRIERAANAHRPFAWRRAATLKLRGGRGQLRGQLPRGGGGCCLSGDGAARKQCKKRRQIKLEPLRCGAAQDQCAHAPLHQVRANRERRATRSPTRSPWRA